MTQYYDLDNTELMTAHKFFHFLVWLNEEGWEPDVDNGFWVKNSNYLTRTITSVLYRDYVSTWPESVKDKI